MSSAKWNRRRAKKRDRRWERWRNLRPLREAMEAHNAAVAKAFAMPHGLVDDQASIQPVEESVVEEYLAKCRGDVS